MADVDLVLMPYANIVHPSIAIGMLTASLKEAGIRTRSHYANLWFSETIGVDSFFLICELSNTELLGEWSFAGSAFPDFRPDHPRYLEELVSYFKRFGNVSALITEERLWKLRNAADTFVNSCADRILSGKPRIVGCSSVFQQHCASLAILRRIRELAPEVVTMMGGANCEDSLGRVTHQCFDWVDFVVSGEADLLISDLCRQILDEGRDVDSGDLPAGVLGPRHRTKGDAELSRATVSSLDKLPLPDYEDYFKALRNSSFSKRVIPGLLVETSRGCWWAQKHQCSFCGLNGCGTGYRSKSADRVIEELEILSRRYGVRKLEAVDNILDMKYFKTVLPALSRHKDKYNLIYETTANLRRSQVKALAEAGIRFIQAGIESMDDMILSRLNKSNRACMNIGLLKWAQEYGVHVAWNFLVDVPGETDRAYLQMADWLPLIFHLQAPTSLLPIRFDRFSPYHRRQKHYGLKLLPSKVYSYVYPLSSEHLMDFAYYFEDQSGSNPESKRPPAKQIAFANSTEGASFRSLEGKAELHHHRHSRWLRSCSESGQGLDEVREIVKQWRGTYYAFSEGIGYLKPNQSRPLLNMREEEGAIVITDTRPCALESEIVIKGLAARIYRTCDSAKTPPRIVKCLNRGSRVRHIWDDLQPAVEELLQRRVMLKLGGRLISLAVREPQRPMPSFDEYAGGSLLRKRERPRVNPRTQNALSWFGAHHADPAGKP
jgi:ribosomal peptide maturation radical SAM protein 1